MVFKLQRREVEKKVLGQEIGLPCDTRRCVTTSHKWANPPSLINEAADFLVPPDHLELPHPTTSHTLRILHHCDKFQRATIPKTPLRIRPEGAEHGTATLRCQRWAGWVTDLPDAGPQHHGWCHHPNFT